jgi:hypothetical protein
VGRPPEGIFPPNAILIRPGTVLGVKIFLRHSRTPAQQHVLISISITLFVLQHEHRRIITGHSGIH